MANPGALLADQRDSPALRNEIRSAINRANRAVSKAEQVKTFRILPRDFTEADGERTPTLKIKRKVVAKRPQPRRCGGPPAVMTIEARPRSRAVAIRSLHH